jgi:hypothetical protein
MYKTETDLQFNLFSSYLKSNILIPIHESSSKWIIHRALRLDYSLTMIAKDLLIQYN